MERVRAAHQKWNAARSLVVQVAAELAEDFASVHARAELKAVLKAEKLARVEFENALRDEDDSGHGGSGGDGEGDDRS